MAENEVIREKAPNFDLGFESSSIHGDMKSAEAFLSETKVVTGEADDLEEMDEEEKEAAEKKKVLEKKPAVKIKEKVKVDPNKTVETLFNEDEEENTEEDKQEETTDEEETTDDNHFQAFSKELYKLGSFVTEEGEEPVIADTPEKFLELFNEQKQRAATDWLEGFLAKHGEDRKELFDAIFLNGADPKDYLPVYNEIEDLEAVDLEKEENQERVIRAYYTRAGWSKDEVDNKVEKLKQYADLEDEAKKVHPKIVQQDKQKLEQIAAQAKEKEDKQTQSDLDYKKGLSTILQEKLKTKDFDGIPLDDNRAAKAFDYLNTKKWKLPSGELLTDFDKFILETKNPDNLSKRIKLALLAIDDFDFSKVKQKAISTESNKLFSSLATKEAKKSNTKQVSVKNGEDPWTKI